MTTKRTRKTIEAKKSPVKKATKKPDNLLGDVMGKIKIKGMDAGAFKRNVKVVTKDMKLDEVPYRIPFKNEGLRLITGGIIGGTFCEIAGQSQSGKSFLAYELMATCQEMGGFVSLNDGERAFEESYGDIVGLNMEDGTFAYTTISDINQIFAFWFQFVKGIRVKKRNSPILLIQDSFPTMVTSMSLDNVGKGDALGYEAMQRNQAFSREMEKFVGFLKEQKATLVVLNQFTKDSMAGMYENPYSSLCEEKMQYYATQRLKGMLGPKLVKTIKVNGKDVKTRTGVKTTWETIKNRAVKPFQKCTVSIRYASGIAPLSGLIKLWTETQKLITGTSKSINGKKLDKAVPICRVSKTITDDDFVIEYDKKSMEANLDDVKELIEKYPALLTPTWTGSYVDGDDEEDNSDYKKDMDE